MTTGLSMKAETITRALPGRRWYGRYGLARCPAHDDLRPSLSICDAHDGKILIYCHAGCDQEHVIAALRSRGLWPDNGSRQSKYFAPRATAAASHRDPSEAKRTDAALAVWKATTPGDGTLVETYLTSRGLYPPLPPTLHFRSGLKHPSGEFWPAMVALVTCGIDDAPQAIHRTFLARDGSGKAPVDPQKMMFGPCRMGAVRLAPAGDLLMVGEGIETCLTAMQATGQPAWAALSASFLSTLELPDYVREIIVLADRDTAGEAAAQKAATRWKREGRRVGIARPTRGNDFNDMLMGRSASIGGHND